MIFQPSYIVNTESGTSTNYYVNQTQNSYGGDVSLSGSSIMNAVVAQNAKSSYITDSYIYLYHLGTYLYLPATMESVTDTQSISFADDVPLARSAPIYSYSHSGPRQVTFRLTLHRELMYQENIRRSNVILSDNYIGREQDYVDYLVNNLQAVAFPRYSSTSKMVDPPLVAVRISNDIYIKGIVNGNVTTTYSLPLLITGKYGVVNVDFTIYEVDPYNATDIAQIGSFRGIDTTLERNIYSRRR